LGKAFNFLNDDFKIEECPTTTTAVLRSKSIGNHTMEIEKTTPNKEDWFTMDTTRLEQAFCGRHRWSFVLPENVTREEKGQRKSRWIVCDGTKRTSKKDINVKSMTKAARIGRSTVMRCFYFLWF
jgi:hypothetical protein